jgi:trimeric autotransporter adhesin
MAKHERKIMKNIHALRNSGNRSSRRRGSILIPLGLVALLTILTKAQAVSPAPDGGYAGGNTAEGQNALQSLTVGIYNTAVGIYSLLSLTDGDFCTGVGAGTLLANTADQNTATGAGALLGTTTGFGNTANGAFTLFSNTTGGANTAMGASALQSNTQGDNNTSIGAAALLNNTATGNTAIGSNALLTNTTGGTLGNVQGFDFGPNVAVGWQALGSNTIASANTAVGYQALHSFTTGPMGFEQLGLCTAVGFQALGNATGGLVNDAFGYRALYNNTEGIGNTAIGLETLISNTTGDSNTATGSGALFNNTTGDSNTAIGIGALDDSISGTGNTAVGVNALDNSTGNFNTAVGVNAGLHVVAAQNAICIGFNVFGADVSDSCYIGNIWNESGGSQAVYVNSEGKLGAQVSSRRFKDQIKPIEDASEVIYGLRPVSFRYKPEIEPTRPLSFGLIAEEVEKMCPKLVTRDKEGKPYSVRYDQVNAMLLNEFLKEHKKVEEQQATIAELKSIVVQQQKGLEAFTAQLKEQAAQLQRVSNQIEVSRLAPQVAANKP